MASTIEVTALVAYEHERNRWWANIESPDGDFNIYDVTLGGLVERAHAWAMGRLVRIRIDVHCGYTEMWKAAEQ
jgi:hypothetical protein